MSKLSKKQRQEIIDRWLQDEEDEEYEVVPLKEEGKFRVKQRKKPGSDVKPETITVKPETEVVKPETITVKPETITETIPTIQPRTTIIPGFTPSISGSESKPKTKSKNKSKAIDSLITTNTQILEHLKFLGEDAQRRNQKKEMKQEVKYQVRRNVITTTNPQSNPSSEPQVIIQYPSYKRSRVNLSRTQTY
jgi:hypothetical protein